MLQGRIESLDVLRAICALLVLAAHLLGETSGLHAGVLMPLASLGVEAVIGFFVLSGCVISLQSYRGPRAYLRNRLLRILPIYYVALGGCLALMLWAHEPFLTTELLGNLFFLQNLFWTPLRPLDFFFSSWSLNYELYYYLAFPLLIARPRLVLPFMALSILTGIGLYALPESGRYGVHEGAYMLLLHPLSLWCFWLVGAWIASRGSPKGAPSLATAAWVMALGFCLTRLPWSSEGRFDFGRLFGVGAAFAVLVWSLLGRDQGRQPAGGYRVLHVSLAWRALVAAALCALLWTRSHSFLAAKVEISAIVVLATLLPEAVVGGISLLLAPVLPILRYIAGLSYALYLVHYPLLEASNRMASPLAPVLRVFLVAGLSFALADILEYRMQSWLRRRLSPSPSVAGASPS